MMTQSDKIKLMDNILANGGISQEEYDKIIPILGGTEDCRNRPTYTREEERYQKYMTVYAGVAFLNPDTASFPPYDPSMISEHKARFRGTYKSIDTYVDALAPEGNYRRYSMRLKIDDNFKLEAVYLFDYIDNKWIDINSNI